MIYSIKILIVNIPFVFEETWAIFKSGEHFFAVFIGSDYNGWLWNYVKMTRFTVFVKGGWGLM